MRENVKRIINNITPSDYRKITKEDISHIAIITRSLIVNDVISFKNIGGIEQGIECLTFTIMDEMETDDEETHLLIFDIARTLFKSANSEIDSKVLDLQFTKALHH